MKKSLTIALLAAAGLAAPAVSHADTIVGAQLQVLPGGEGEFDADVPIIDASGSADLETAYGIALLAEYVVHPNVTVGLAPRFLFNVKLEDQDDSGTQLDIPLRATLRFLVTPKLAVFGQLSVGYSIIFPGEWPEDADNPAGLIAGLGGGVAFRLTQSAALVGEVGYTAGFHGVTIDNPIGDDDVKFANSYPHVGIGVQTAF